MSNADKPPAILFSTAGLIYNDKMVTSKIKTYIRNSINYIYEEQYQFGYIQFTDGVRYPFLYLREIYGSTYIILKQVGIVVHCRDTLLK